MAPATIRRLAGEARVGRLATVDANGVPHLVPVCFALSGSVVFHAVDWKPKRSASLRRLANISATGRACLLVDQYDEDWSTLWWVRLDGVGRVVSDPVEAAAGIDLLVAKYGQYAQRRPAGPVIALDVLRYSGWSATPDRP